MDNNTYLRYGIKNHTGVVFARFEFASDRDICFDVMNRHNKAQAETEKDLIRFDIN